MEVIRLLKYELQLKEDELAKAAELMKFYKLELKNRENNFNKMFNAAPNIGVMNPLEKVPFKCRKLTFSRPPKRFKAKSPPKNLFIKTRPKFDFIFNYFRYFYAF